MTRSLIRLLAWLSLIAMAPFVTAPLAAQSNDAARTLIGFSLGLLTSSSNVWDIPNQVFTPLSHPPKEGDVYDPDIWHLRRDLLTRRPVFRIHGTHFVSAHVGYTAELSYIGLKSADACTVVQHGLNAMHPGDPTVRQVCDSIPVTPQGSRATAAVQAGLVVRPFAGSVVQPYVEALAGVVSAQSSMATLTSSFAGSSLSIYQDPKWGSVHPTWTLGAGFATPIVPGLLLHVGVRDSWVAQSIVTGASAGEGTETPVATRFKGFVSVLVGLDIVLARQRGRRY